MARRALMVLAGVVLAGASTGIASVAAASAASAASGVSAGAAGGAPPLVRPHPAGPPTASPPLHPATTTVTGTPVNGVQVSATAPGQLPLDLAVGPAQPAPRELDVTVKDTGGAGYAGPLSTVFTEERAAGSATFTVTGMQRFDPVTASWQKLTPVGTQNTYRDDVTVTVPAAGQAVVKYRFTAGINLFDDLKIVSSANGATVTATVPVTRVKADLAGLPGSIRAGVPYLVTGKLTNNTDVDYAGVDVEFFVQGCGSSGGGCFLAKDSKLEVQTGAVWKPVVLKDLQQVPGFSGFALKDSTLARGASISIPLRLTLPVNNLPVSALHFALNPDIAGQVAADGTLIAAPVPSTASRTSETSPSATDPSTTDTASSQPTDTPTPSDSAASPAPSDTGSPSTTSAGAATPTSSSSNATVLLAVGLLVFCGGLVGGYFYLKQRGRL